MHINSFKTTWWLCGRSECASHLFIDSPCRFFFFFSMETILTCWSLKDAQRTLEKTVTLSVFAQAPSHRLMDKWLFLSNTLTYLIMTVSHCEAYWNCIWIMSVLQTSSKNEKHNLLEFSSRYLKRNVYKLNNLKLNLFRNLFSINYP